MNQQLIAHDLSRNRQDRIRGLGFEPSHLTASEQEELLDLYECLRDRPFPTGQAPARR